MISTKREARDISLYTQMWRPSKATSGLSVLPTPFSFIGVSFPSWLPKVLPLAMRCASWINDVTYQWILTGLFGASVYTFARVSITTTVLPSSILPSNVNE